MKRLILVLGLLIFPGIAMAQESCDMSEQSLDTDNNYLGANIQAEMPQGKQKQKMHIHLNVLTVNVQYIRTESVTKTDKN